MAISGIAAMVVNRVLWDPSLNSLEATFLSIVAIAGVFLFGGYAMKKGLDLCSESVVEAGPKRTKDGGANAY